MNRQQRMALAHWRLWDFFFSNSLPAERSLQHRTIRLKVLQAMERTYNLAGGQQTFDNLRTMVWAEWSIRGGRITGARRGTRGAKGIRE